MAAVFNGGAGVEVVGDDGGGDGAEVGAKGVGFRPSEAAQDVAVLGAEFEEGVLDEVVGEATAGAAPAGQSSGDGGGDDGLGEGDEVIPGRGGTGFETAFEREREIVVFGRHV